MLGGSGAWGDGCLESWHKDFGPKSSVPESFTFFPALSGSSDIYSNELSKVKNIYLDIKMNLL